MKHPTPEQLSAFHDGIAGEKLLVAIEAHLNDCAECREALASLERQDRALGAALTHDPGDAHFEALASRIEKRLGEKPSRVAALRGVVAMLRGALGGTAATIGGWLEGFWSGLRAFRAPEWAGALAAVVVATALVVFNMKHGTGPAPRDTLLEERSRQEAKEPRAADEARETEPATPLGRESAREDGRQGAAGADRTVRAIQPPTIAPAPTGAMMKLGAPSARARIVQSTPAGENVRGPAAQEAFAKPPGEVPGGPAMGMKPRRAEPLEENRPRVEGGAAQAMGAKDAERAQTRDQAAANAKAAAPSPTAVLPPAPESPQAAAPSQREGTRPSSAALAAPQAEKLEARAAGAVRVCGIVKDAGGRPIASATVTLVSQGSGATSDADGRFCVEGPPGEQTISVIAVGFLPLQLDARFAPGSPPLALTLIAVAVLGPDEILRGKLKMLQGAAQTGAPAAVNPMPPESLEIVETQAMRLTLEAARAGSATRYETAAAEWERVRDRTPEGSANLEARFRVAEARYHAWAIAPSPQRTTAADEALTSYLVRAPLGARRDTATGWLGRVKP